MSPIRIFTYARNHLLLVTILLLTSIFVICSELKTAKVMDLASKSLVNTSITILKPNPLSKLMKITPTKRIFQLAGKHTPNPVSTPSILGTLFDQSIDLRAGPVSIPLQIRIPVINVDAPILSVGLTEDNAMDAPKGRYGDPNWSSAFWYRGSAIPGEPGTATIGGHVNGLLGQPETFARIKKLKPGDEIIISRKKPTLSLTFIVDEVQVYSIQESSEPEILARIYGGATNNNSQQSLQDNLSHLTLITCAGNYIHGEFDHHTVVFATLKSKFVKNSLNKNINFSKVFESNRSWSWANESAQ